ncbi:phospholipase B-like 1, partial [Huso huso]
KVTDFKLAQKFISEAVNGPTVQGGLPAFSWREFSQTRHAGLPESYNFTFLTMQPVLFEP